MSKNRKARRLEDRARKKLPPEQQSVQGTSKFPQVARGIAIVQELLASNKLADAAELLDQLLNIEPENAESHFHAGSLSEMRGQQTIAMMHYQKCLNLNRYHISALVKLAQTHSSAGDYPEALKVVQIGLKNSPNDPQLHHLAGQIYEGMQHYREAAQHFSSLAKLRPQRGAFEILGNACMLSGDTSSARQAFKSAIQHGSKPEHILAVLARLEAGIGDRPAAIAHLKSAMRQAPRDGFAYLQLANDFSEGIDAGELMEAANQARPISIEQEHLEQDEIPMCFAYARLHELKGEYDNAFAYYELGNRSLVKISSYEPGVESNKSYQVRSRYSEFSAQSPELAGSQNDDQPVFVFGLPRTGTTLLEQILSAHPEVAGIGEHEAFGWIARYLESFSSDRLTTASEYYLSSYPPHARTARRIVDKSMSTPEHIGTILSVFPNARFIHCRRHPLETAWSMYSMYFGDRRVLYANSFAGIAARFQAYDDIMQFWHERLPGLILEVRYDDLITYTQEFATTALEHIGLSWHPDCDEFYKSKNMVRTASVTQVRQPIYTTASQKWRRYEWQLQPLIEMLSPLIEAYETSAVDKQQSV